MHHGLGMGAQVASGVGTGYFGLLGGALLRALRAGRVPQTVVVGWRVHGTLLETAGGWFWDSELVSISSLFTVPVPAPPFSTSLG